MSVKVLKKIDIQMHGGRGVTWEKHYNGMYNEKTVNL